MRARLAGTAVAAVALVLTAGPASAATALTPASLTGTAAQEWWLTGSFGYAGAWSASLGDNVTVAVIGDEQDLGAQDLAGSFKDAQGFGPTVPALDTVMTSTVCYGTEVSSLIAGHGHTAAAGVDGTVGVAPHAKIMPIVVVPAADALPTVPDMVKAIQTAVSHGVKVIQIDFKTHEDPRITAAVSDAEAHNVTVVAPVGDDGDVQHTFAPADVPGVVAVGGVQRSDGKYWDSSVPGPNVTVAAPATNLLVEAPWKHYVIKSGTACAAALVSGELADLWSLHPAWSAEQIKRALTQTASGHGTRLNDEIGYGVADPTAAMAFGKATQQTTGPANHSGSSGGSSSSGTVIIAAVGGVVGLGLIGGLVWFLIRKQRKPGYVLPEPAPLLNYGPSDYAEYYQEQYPYAAPGPEAAPEEAQPAYPQYPDASVPGPVAFDEQGYTVFPQQQAMEPPQSAEAQLAPQEQDPGAPQER